MTLPKDRTYHIAFDTKEVPGRIQATFVTLGTELIKDDGTTFHVNLSDDPLYPALVQYVKNNPPRAPE